ncbi:ATP-dependent DNA ligase [Phellopilus nigrolimitatus]|nr:ATP-dependent DNA ligase [Phellopilus nigrolimitatus]
MSSKRSLSSTSSPAKKRNIQATKPENLQGSRGSLDSFFKQNGRASTSKLTVEDFADDREFALKLAVEEGIDVETARMLEEKWKPAAPPSKHRALEVIDVDAVSDDGHSRALLSASRDAFIDVSSYPDLAVDSLIFSVSDCPWQTGFLSSPTPYSFLTHTLSSLSGTRSRIAISNILTNSLRFIIRHDPTSLLPALYLLSNSLAPPYIPVELGLGPSIISKAIQQVSGLTPASLKRLYNATGDAGDVAFEARSNLQTLVPHPALTVTGVYNSLLKICRTKGEGAMKQKQSVVEKLLVASKGEESRYLVRTMSQHIRVGAVRASILTALARAMVLTRPSSQNGQSDSSPYFSSAETLSRVKKLGVGKGKKKKDEDPIRSSILSKFIEAEGLLKRVYVQHPNYDHLVQALLEVGPEGLAEKVSLSVGIPLHPTLGSPARSLDEVYDRLGNLPFTAEFKYDGQRAQIHAMKNEDGDLLIRLFSRHLEDMTDKYPDISSLVEEMFKSRNDLMSFIIDTEIVAIDPVDGSLKTFQELSNRARKDVRLEEIKINVCVFAFDLMLLNDSSLLKQPFRIRRQKLKTHFPPVIPNAATVARFSHVESCESGDGRETVEEFWQRAVDSRSEGLMIKLLDNGEIADDSDSVNGNQRKKPLPATYEPDKRTSAWLKLKKDYVLGLGDSLDLVPIGAWHGNGRKAAWWSPILLAVWDESAGRLVAVCKCMSGKDSDCFHLRIQITMALGERYPEGTESCSRTSLWDVNTGGLGPEVYFKPQEVWEIRGADITLSPVSVAARGLVSKERGLSLRFPRFIRLREDKGLTDASSPEFLAMMWEKQENKGKKSKGIDDGELIDVSPEVSDVEEDEYE